MARYAEQGVLAVSRDRLWEFLELHVDDASITKIHPDVRGQTTRSHEGDSYVVERSILFRRKLVPSVWKISYHKPDFARWEILESSAGPMAPGSFLENRYSDDPGGTLVSTEGELTVVGFPKFFQRRVVRFAINHIDDQDVAYLAAHP